MNPKQTHSRSLKVLSALVLVVAALAAVVVIAGAAPGDLDTGFGGDGMVTTPVGSGNDEG